MPVYNLTSKNTLNTNCFGEMLLPTVELINPVTGQITKTTIKKNFVVNPATPVKDLYQYLEYWYEGLSNSKVKSIEYTKRYEVDPSGSAVPTVKLETAEDLQIVYDWETRTGEVETRINVLNQKLAYASFDNSRYTLHGYFNHPCIFAYTATTNNQIRIYLSSRNTFTTTAEQIFRILICFANGDSGYYEVPVVRTV